MIRVHSQVTTLQAVLFEIQLLRTQGPDAPADTSDNPEFFHSDSQQNKPSGSTTVKDIPPKNQLDLATIAQIERRGSQGLRSILLKGEMRFLKDVNMLIFLCSPL